MEPKPAGAGGRPALIGVLALQGGVAEHLESLRRLDQEQREAGGEGIRTRRVLTAADLEGLDGIILPGGESTAVGKLLEEGGLGAALMAALGSGLAAWGTCMGAILLARRVSGGELRLPLMDIAVERNAYGGQLDSFSAAHALEGLGGGDFPMVFIRAPVISAVGPEVEVLARVGGAVVACRQGRLLATTFHPELSADTRVHALFVRIAAARDPAPCIG